LYINGLIRYHPKYGEKILTEIVKKIVIKASPRTIWTLMIQHLKYPEKEVNRGLEWDKLVIKEIRGEALTSDRSGIGVKTRWYYKFYFYTFRWDDEVIEWNKLRKIAWKSISTWDMVDSFSIESINNKTRLIYAMNYEPPYGILGKLWYRLFVHKHIEKNLEYTLLQMKRNAERVPKFRSKGIG
jgi:hypothetical protein